METGKQENAKQVILEVNGKEYVLEFNRTAIKHIEQKGFSLVEFSNKLVTSTDLLIEGALYKNQKYLTPKDIENIITYIYEKVDVSALVEVLSEMLRDALPMFTEEEDGAEKQGFKIVR